MTEFTDDKLKEFKEVFEIFDRDKDGFLSIPECQNAYLSLGYDFTPEEIIEISTEDDKKEGNVIHFNAFVHFLNKQGREGEMEEELIDCFKSFDKDGDGKINHKELKYLLINMGERLLDDEIEEMISEIDSKEEGGITYKDFVKLMFSK